MATLATHLWNWILGGLPQSLPTPSAAAGTASIHRSRPVPGEDIYFFQKSFDNSQVRRTEDPAERKTCWQAVAGTFACALLLIALLLPSAYKLWAGYQIARIDEERTRLERERAELISEQARLISPERLEKLANAQQMIDPATAALDPAKAKGSLAKAAPPPAASVTQ